MTAAIRFPTLYDALAPGSSWKARLVQTLGLSLLLGLIAQIEFHLPFTPVPVTAQTFAVLLTGALLGRRWGPLCIAMYIAEGCSGFPFFAGGAWGPAHLLGPSGGYLIGFIPAAWLVGNLAGLGWDRSPLTTLLMMSAGSAVVFAVGLLGLLRFVPPAQLLPLGLFPFLIGDLFKICLSAAVLPLGRRFLDASFRH